MNYEIEFEKAVYNLLRVWQQYNSWGSDENHFSHACMTSGESAATFLERHGYGKETGWGFEPNDKAKILMERDELSD